MERRHTSSDGLHFYCYFTAPGSSWVLSYEISAHIPLLPLRQRRRPRLRLLVIMKRVPWRLLTRCYAEKPFEAAQDAMAEA
ncbi:MAG: hypothetical protein CM15mP103_00230 [Gammaproteobacteria bacterium]|nr:MAG: hypothetical protein CM15mP103_00230 [Gammaproteobacteria bacterium]